MLYISSNYKALERELDRLEALPRKGKVKPLLDAALGEGFLQTQANVHVITGSLKGSGKKKSKADNDDWVGEITYGGPSVGFAHNPVDYAIYEREKGGDHDFLTNLDFLHSLFVQAMKEGLAG